MLIILCLCKLDKPDFSSQKLHIECLLNVQHNCKASQCEIHQTRNQRIERQITSGKGSELLHKDNKHFILNSAAFYNGAIHRRWAQFELPTVSSHRWKRSINQGLSKWDSELGKRMKKKQEIAEKAAMVADRARLIAMKAAAEAAEAIAADARVGGAVFGQDDDDHDFEQGGSNVVVSQL